MVWRTFGLSNLEQSQEAEVILATANALDYYISLIKRKAKSNLQCTQRIMHLEDITRWQEDMNFKFEWQEQYLACLLPSLVRYCSCHSDESTFDDFLRISDHSKDFWKFSKFSQSHCPQKCIQCVSKLNAGGNPPADPFRGSKGWLSAPLSKQIRQNDKL